MVKYCCAADSGSVLVEALVGISMLALVVASLATFNGSLARAVEGNERRVTALRAANTNLHEEALAAMSRGSSREFGGIRALVCVVEPWQEVGSRADRC
jgi:hypothetical protein